MTRVQGDPDHPPTHGALCTKVSRYAERTYSGERVLTPLKRVGPKGSGRFEPVSWDAALDDIAARLQAIASRDRDSAQAILPYSYAGTMGLVQGEAMAGRFFHRLGASLLDRTICSSAGGDALVATYGAKVGMHVEWFAESRLIVIWGSNSITSNLHFWTFAQQAKRAGARLVCIDPRRSETAEKCHDHIALLPGTDGALALALMHELIANDWLDHSYIEQHLQGWTALRGPRAAMAARARGAGVRGRRRRGARPGPRVRDDQAGGDPAELRDAARARRRQRGAADRAAAVPGRRVAAPRRRFAVVGVGLVPRSAAAMPGCSGPTCWKTVYGPAAEGRKPRTVNMSTIGDDLLRDASPAFGRRSKPSSSTTATRSRWRPTARRSFAGSCATTSSPSSSSTS